MTFYIQTVKNQIHVLNAKTLFTPPFSAIQWRLRPYFTLTQTRTIILGIHLEIAVIAEIFCAAGFNLRWIQVCESETALLAMHFNTYTEYDS